MGTTRWILVAAGCAAAITAVTFRAGGRAAPGPGRHDKLRIISLAPSATEILFALDAGDCLIGVTSFCNYPPAASQIEQVGGFGMPSVEKVLALSPDLVVASAFERTETADLLRASGIRLVEVQAHSFAEIFAAIQRTGKAIDRLRQADELVVRMQAEIETLARQRAALAGWRTPKVFVELWDSPLTTAGARSLLDDVIARAGGVNVAHEISQSYFSVNPEQVIQWDPDVILVARMTRAGDAATELSGRIGWAGISAVKHGRIVDDISSDLLLRPGPRLVEGVKRLAARLQEVVPAAESGKDRGGPARQ